MSVAPQIFPDSAAFISSEAAAAPLNVAVVGFGTVGEAVVRILCTEQRPELRLTHICVRSVARRKSDSVPGRVQWTSRFEDVLGDEIDVVVELIGGTGDARTLVSEALRRGKAVVTANKKLIAHHGAELFAIARQNDAKLMFGASVAGGVPVLSGIYEGLAGDRLTAIRGIVNGTCNFMLSEMEGANATYEDALREAQRLGYAEADPTEDVEGLDAQAKLAILSRVAFGADVAPEQIACRGISAVRPIDFTYARRMGCTIRLVASADLNGGELFAAVTPTLVPQKSLLGRAKGNENVVIATGAYGGDMVFAGAGAGGNATAVAVVSDLLSLARTQRWIHPTGRVREISGVSDNRVCARFVRFTIADRPGILAGIAAAFAKHDINIDSVLQEPGLDKAALPFAIVLEPCPDAALNAALAILAKYDHFPVPPLALPILEK